MAVGDRKAKSTDSVYTNSSYVSQHPWDHVEGTPFGTRGGIVVNHVFPADGEYVFGVALNSGDGVREAPATKRMTSLVPCTDSTTVFPHHPIPTIAALIIDPPAISG